MAEKTTNYGLTKPLPEEFYDINVHNNNMDIIDEELGKCATITVSSEVPEDSDFWIDPDDVSAEEAHLTDMNNPHRVTIAQIGAAPSGYGLGGEAATISSWNMATKTGFYKSATDSPNGQWFEGLVVSYNTSHCVQYVWRAAENIHCQRQMIDGTWNEWEYVNPPAILGTEYRTTERWQGKVVYRKLVDFGTLPNKGMKQVQHGAAATNIVRYAATRSDGEAIPMWYDTHKILIDVSKFSVVLSTSFDASAKTATVQIWYTKD